MPGPQGAGRCSSPRPGPAPGTLHAPGTMVPGRPPIFPVR
ncbi:hypothetical protein C4K10_3282 [Pseudomonas chlororaphis subsp. aureofaciens]|nr:hypothetical protein C4K10_3282 [Pseudomonas chlororaphis subsp. aureofaciens]